MNRSELSQTLHTLCENVYFQPPDNVDLTYPCIIYTLNRVNSTYADNIAYKTRREYNILYITKNPEPIYELTGEGMIETFLHTFDHIKHTNHYTKDNLYHDAFNLFY